MKNPRFFGAILSIALFFLGGETGKAATLYLDLDRDAPGIQSTRALDPGSTFEFEVLFSADGATRFDTFAFDVVHTSPNVTLHSPLAGPIVDSAPLMALDMYGANALSSGDALTRGSQPTPLGFEDGLGGVGVSSVGGMPFPLLGQDETVGLFSGSLTALNGGTSTLALSGFPFGVGAELNLGGERVPVILQGATVTVVPLPPAVWLFASGVLALLGVGRRRVAPIDAAKRMFRRWVFLLLALISSLGFAAVDSNADLNGDAMVTSQDISKLAGCFGQDPLSNSDCAKADVDEDGDIDVDDFRFVSERLGKAYTWSLYPTPVFSTDSKGYNPRSVVATDVNGDSSLDVIVGRSDSNDITVLLGNGDGSFQTPQHYDAGGRVGELATGDINGDGVLELVVATADGISVLIVNQDGSFQAPERVDTSDACCSVVIGDVNDDGVLDIVTNGRSGNLSVMLGAGDGDFHVAQRYAAGDRPGSVALGDLNGDGALDVVVINVGDDYDGDLGGGLSVLIGNGDGSFQMPQRYEVGRLPNSVALGDINGDGSIDAVVANSVSSDISVLLGNGEGGFQVQEPLLGDGRSVGLGDIDGDGSLDVVLSGGDVKIWLGYGDGSFQIPRRYAAGRGFMMTIGDFNNDGLLDVVSVTEGSVMEVAVLLNNKNGSFQTSQTFETGRSPHSISLGDIDNDGLLDAVVVNNDGVSVLIGNGDSGFQTEQRYVTGDSPISMSLGDLNGDGALDMVVANQGDWHLVQGDLSVLLGNGDGSFQSQQRYAAGDRPSSVSLGDLNRDGALDVVVADNWLSDEISVLLGNGDGSFQAPQQYAAGNFPRSVVLGDINGDGLLDVVVANIGSNYEQGDISVLMGNGDGAFQIQRHFAVGEGPGSLALGDINDDGTLDIVVSNFGSNDISVLLSDGDGSFQEQQRFSLERAGSLALGDINRDGVLDVVVTNASDYVSLLLGNGDGTFQMPQSFAVGWSPSALSLGDVNGDNSLDLLVAKSSRDELAVLLGSGY